MIDPGSEAETQTARHSPRMSRGKRWVLWIGCSLLVLVLLAGTALAILLRRAEPMMRASLIDTLQKRFHSRVELDDLHVSILDGFWVEGRGLRIWLPENSGDSAIPAPNGQPQWRTEPWIHVGKLRFHASWRILPGKPIEVSVIHIEDVRVLLPPKEDRPHLSFSGNKPDAQSQNAKSQPVSQDKANQDASEQDATRQDATRQDATRQDVTKVSLFKMPPILIKKIECQAAELVIERHQEEGRPPKLPLDFQLRKITLIPDGHGGPVAFEVDMINAKPIGVIHSVGHFGPWISGDPGSLPVSGDYKFDHADLSTIKGIAGMLASTGKYTGTLRNIEADGETRTPDFRLERVNKNAGVLLTTRFHAIVDGTNGDTYLQPVDAMLGHTHIVASGQVVRASDMTPGAKGHDVTLEVAIDRGRIEDILDISANSEKPFMTGNLTLQNHFHLPPNPPEQQISVWERLQLDGRFHLSQARFSNATMQGRIEQLSLRGQGKPKEVKTTDPTSILSDMQGDFQLSEGFLHLPDLEYRVPGAAIVAHGTYGFKGGTLAFEGDARLDATLSQVVGGWKGFLLKPADRYLKKNGAGTDVPIHVQGTRKEPKFGVDFDRLGKSDGSGSGAEKSR